MKKNFKYAMMMATALVLGFSSCSSDDNDPIEGGEQVVSGQPTFAEVTIRVPQTYAYSGTIAGTDDESKINTVDVYTFDAITGAFETTKNFTSITIDGSGKAKLGEIPANTGKKKIFAVINKPINVTNETTKSVTNLTSSELTFDNISDFAEAGKFVMSSQIVEQTLKALPKDNTVANPNKIVLEVKRLAAKLTAASKGPLADLELKANDGKIVGGLEFAVGQINTKAFLAQNISASGAVIDPNYYNTASGWVPGNGLNVLSPYVWVPLNDDESNHNNLTSFYVLENTNELPLMGDVTYLVFKGTFVPKETMKLEGGKWVPSETYGVAADKSFWKINTSEGKKLFKSEEDAKAYAEDVLGITDFDTWKADNLFKYEKGVTYYTVYPNRENKGLSNIERNTFHRTNVKSIFGLGDNTPGPSDKDKDTPVGVETEIEVEISVLDWAMYTEDVELQPHQ